MQGSSPVGRGRSGGPGATNPLPGAATLPCQPGCSHQYPAEGLGASLLLTSEMVGLEGNKAQPLLRVEGPSTPSQGFNSTWKWDPGSPACAN